MLLNTLRFCKMTDDAYSYGKEKPSAHFSFCFCILHPDLRHPENCTSTPTDSFGETGSPVLTEFLLETGSRLQ